MSLTNKYKVFWNSPVTKLWEHADFKDSQIFTCLGDDTKNEAFH